MSSQQDGGASLPADSLASVGDATASISPFDYNDFDENTVINAGTIDVALKIYILPTLATIRREIYECWEDLDVRLYNMEEDLIKITAKIPRGHAGLDDSEAHVKASEPQKQESHAMKQEFRVMRQELRVMRRELRGMRRKLRKHNQRHAADVSPMSKRDHINAIAARQIATSARLQASKKKISHH